MNFLKILMYVCLYVSVSIGANADTYKITIQKELEAHEPYANIDEPYISLLKIEIMKNARKKHKKETFAQASKLNNALKQELENKLTTKITQKKLGELKEKWNITPSKDNTLLKKVMFQRKNADLFKPPEKKKNIFLIADWMKFPIFDIANSYNPITSDKNKQKVLNYETHKYSENFQTLSQIAAVLYNRASFMDSFLVMYLTFLYTAIDLFPIFLSLMAFLWLLPLAILLRNSDEEISESSFLRYVIDTILWILGLIICIFLVMSFIDFFKILLVILVGFIFAPIMIFIFFIGLSFSTESFVFFGDSSISMIMLEMIRYKLIYKMGLNIDLNYEFLWFVIKLFILILTSNKIYYSISIVVNYFTVLRNYKHIFATGGVFALFVIMYISDSNHLIALFEIFKRYFL